MRVPGEIETFRYVAFEITDAGEVVQMFAPRRAENRDHAIRAARVLAQTYAGAAAWRVRGNADGHGGEPEMLFSQGTIGSLEDAP